MILEHMFQFTMWMQQVHRVGKVNKLAGRVIRKSVSRIEHILQSDTRQDTGSYCIHQPRMCLFRCQDNSFSRLPGASTSIAISLPIRKPLEPALTVACHNLTVGERMRQVARIIKLHCVLPLLAIYLDEVFQHLQCPGSDPE